MRPEAAFRSYQSHLPHWRAAGEVQHVVWRLAVGQSPLTAPEREIIQTALGHFDGDRYTLVASAVMDDHVHVLVNPGEIRLERVVHSWKSFTAHQLVARGRRPAIWQREYYDHLIRSERELENAVAYVLHNPVARWPEAQDYPWVRGYSVIL